MQRQYATQPVRGLTLEIKLVLKLMNHIVKVAPSRKCNLRDQPHILYTDASDVPTRTPRYGLGAVLIQQDPVFLMQYFSCSPPESVVEAWKVRSTYMGQLEPLVCPTALSMWKDILCNKQLIHFINNDSAAAGLVKGYFPQADSSAIIGEYWSVAATWGSDPYIDRVESKSNLSDEPSRFLFHTMDMYKANCAQPAFPDRQVSPIFHFYGESAAQSR